MALGIEQNSIAPSLIQNSGNAMTEIIRETGRQVQGHIVELQTRRDMSAMAQEMQGLVPQSEEFPMQLIQLASRHPLALADERGKIAVSVLGKAHNDWRREQEVARGFGYAPQVGIYDKSTGAVTTPYEPSMRPSTPKGFSGVPGGILNRDTGEVQPLPTSVTNKRTTTDAALRAKRNFDISQLQTQIKLLNEEISPLETSYRELDKAERDFSDETDTKERARVYGGRQNIGPKLQELGKQREILKDQLRKLINSPLQSQPEGDIPNEDASLGGMVPSGLSPQTQEATDAAILPPLPPTAAEPVAEEFVLVFDPNGKPGRVRASQIDAALKNGYRRR